MLLLGQQTPFIEDLLNRSNKQAEALLEHLPAGFDRIALRPDLRLYDQHDHESFYLVKEGLLFAELEGRVTLVLQPGDIAGIEHCLGHPPSNYYGEDPVILERYERSAFHERLLKSTDLTRTWLHYLYAQTGLFQVAFGQLIRDQQRPQAGFLRFRTGDRIIQQGDMADHVYTLMRGSARVFRDETEVGIIREGEIFGAIAALINAPRNASVFAGEDCTVMAIPKEQFSGLLRSQPETGLHLLQSMARTINDLNLRVADRPGANSPHV